MDREERRYFEVPDMEVRNEDGEGPFVVRGHATTFMEPYSVGSFDEQVAPSFFDGLLDDPDTMALWNHNDDLVLGSVGSGTLDLTTDDRGLVAEITLPKSATREREAIERRDVRKMSIGFRVAEEGDRWEVQDNGRELRTLVAGERLFDASPVAFPANPATDLGVAQRSLERWRDDHEGDDERARKRSHKSRERKLALAEAGGAP